MTREFAELDTEQGCTPLGIDVVTLLPGKKDWPYHLHATQWEIYIAIEGVARMRLNENYIDMVPGDSIQCAPGAAHQIINESESPFTYWLVTNSPEFDVCYYPDSDKLSGGERILGPLSDGQNWTKTPH